MGFSQLDTKLIRLSFNGKICFLLLVTGWKKANYENMAQMKQSRPTIRDVARAAGVSSATISNVIQGKRSEVSESTIQRISEVINRLGYVKNLSASSLSGGQSHVLAVITPGAFNPDPAKDTPEINPFYGEFIYRLEHEARAHGYALVLYAGREERFVHFLLQRNVDAAVLLGVLLPDLPSIMAQQPRPLILLDSVIDDPLVMNVRLDERHGGKLSALHLIHRGCRKLAFLGDVPQTGMMIPTLRFEGARCACNKAGIEIVLVSRSTSFQEGFEAAAPIIDLGVDGVVTAADILAAGLIHGLRKHGREVPEDVAVMGFDNLQLARLVQPSLSTIDQRLDEKINALIDLVINGRPGDIRVIQPLLLTRESA